MTFTGYYSSGPSAEFRIKKIPKKENPGNPVESARER